MTPTCHDKNFLTQYRRLQIRSGPDSWERPIKMYARRLKKLINTDSQFGKVRHSACLDAFGCALGFVGHRELMYKLNRGMVAKMRAMIEEHFIRHPESAAKRFTDSLSKSIGTFPGQPQFSLPLGRCLLAWVMGFDGWEDLLEATRAFQTRTDDPATSVVLASWTAIPESARSPVHANANR